MFDRVEDFIGRLSTFSRSLHFETTKYSKALITLDFIYFFILHEFCVILHRRILYECIQILELQKFENLRIIKQFTIDCAIIVCKIVYTKFKYLQSKTDGHIIVS